ncbi:hypothetical protein ACYE2N_14995 [Flavobacterium sp. MAHUQ-51]|uniref:hypothetical protein n=1 Tax=Flavobacterium sp. GCM10022190 TaxID=3252639 RepID=UPI00360BE9B4
MKEEENPSKETLDQWSKDPNNWIGGCFITIQKTNASFLPRKLNGWDLPLISPIQNRF